MKTLVAALDAIAEVTGRAIAWLTVPMVLLTTTIVVLRYLFDAGAIWLQESVMYLHGSVFLLGAAYTLKHDAHVRVDIVYSRLGPRGRHWIDLIGSLAFLFPVAALVLIYTVPYVIKSWSLLEGSPEVGGIPAVFLLKTLLPISAILLILQGLAEALRNALALLQHAER